MREEPLEETPGNEPEKQEQEMDVRFARRAAEQLRETQCERLYLRADSVDGRPLGFIERERLVDLLETAVAMAEALRHDEDDESESGESSPPAEKPVDEAVRRVQNDAVAHEGNFYEGVW